MDTEHTTITIHISMWWVSWNYNKKTDWTEKSSSIF